MYDELATAAETAADSKGLRVLYYRKLFGKRFHQGRSIKGPYANLLTSAENQIKRWKKSLL